MSKSILIVDTPNSCDECKFETEMLNCGKPMCVATPYRRERIEDDSSKPSWCPLRPMPQEKEVNMMKQNEYEVALNEGWNACLDAITGEKDESNRHRK